MHWLRKSPEQMKLTSSDPAEVLVWLEERLKENPPLDGYQHEPSWLDAARESLARFPGDVVWGFYTVGQQYRAIAAVSCPRTFNATSETLPPCPLGQPAA
ncbi:hypothetical protein [Kitasatospora sp. NPDC051914]|uniref:hypothetical protein n=1 Tax=Kitasatospora sp. NPDC051914 TaxID=3154945 RepID=UPI00343B1BC1